MVQSPRLQKRKPGAGLRSLGSWEHGELDADEETLLNNWLCYCHGEGSKRDFSR